MEIYILNFKNSSYFSFVFENESRHVYDVNLSVLFVFTAVTVCVVEKSNLTIIVPNVHVFLNEHGDKERRLFCSLDTKVLKQ